MGVVFAETWVPPLPQPDLQHAGPAEAGQRGLAAQAAQPSSSLSYIRVSDTKHFAVVRFFIFLILIPFLTNPPTSVVEPEPPFLAGAGAGAVKKGAAPAPALQLKLQLWPYV